MLLNLISRFAVWFIKKHSAWSFISKYNEKFIQFIFIKDLDIKYSLIINPKSLSSKIHHLIEIWQLFKDFLFFV